MKRSHTSFCDNDGPCWCKETPKPETPRNSLGPKLEFDLDKPKNEPLEYYDSGLSIGDAVEATGNFNPKWPIKGEQGIVQAFAMQGRKAVVFFPTSKRNPVMSVTLLKPL